MLWLGRTWLHRLPPLSDKQSRPPPPSPPHIFDSQNFFRFLPPQLSSSSFLSSFYVPTFHTKNNGKVRVPKNCSSVTCQIQKIFLFCFSILLFLFLFCLRMQHEKNNLVKKRSKRSFLFLLFQQHPVESWYRIKIPRTRTKTQQTTTNNNNKQQQR